MTGRIAFEAWGNIDPKFILEAAPDSEAVPMVEATSDASEQSPKDRRPLGGWVAAAVCAIVALGVYLGAMWLGQGGWEPPANTGEGTAETVETVETTVTDTGETVEETVTDPEPQPEPKSYVFANPHFIVEKISGQYYLNLWRGNSNHNLGYIPWLEFDSMDAMFNALYNGELTETQIQNIGSMPLDTSLGYRMTDLWNMVEPVIPEGGQLKRISWYGDTYDFYYAHPNVSAGVSLCIYDRTETDGWAKREAYRKSKDGYPKTDVIVDGISAIATTQVTETVTYINLYLAIEDEASDREIYFYAQYETTADADPQNVVSTTSPCKLALIGLQGNKRFSDQVDYGKLPVLNREFFLSFAIRPYTPPVSEPPTELSANEPYVIEITDGVHYLTFPEWDGNRLQISLPEGQNLRAPVYQTATELIEKINSQKLSCYEIEVFKLMADDNGRMRLPNTEKYLAPTLPDYVPKEIGFTFNQNGDYCGILEYSDCTGQYDCYFSVISEEEWLAKREEKYFVGGEKELTFLTVLEGTYDGLPCTFYEYAYGKNPTEGEWVLCHIKQSEENHEREYFLTFYGDLYDLDLDFDEKSVESRYLEDKYAYYASIYGVIDGQYYYFNIQEVHKPTAEILSDFAVTPVTP